MDETFAVKIDRKTKTNDREYIRECMDIYFQLVNREIKGC